MRLRECVNKGGKYLDECFYKQIKQNGKNCSLTLQNKILNSVFIFQIREIVLQDPVYFNSVANNWNVHVLHNTNFDTSQYRANLSSYQCELIFLALVISFKIKYIFLLKQMCSVEANGFRPVKIVVNSKIKAIIQDNELS